MTKESDLKADIAAIRKSLRAGLVAINRIEASRIAAQEPESTRERWNIERDGADLLVCFNDHEKHEKCHYERFVPASAQSSSAEAVAYQQFVDGKWVECSYFIAYGWGNEISPSCRALYTTPPPERPVASAEPVAQVYRQSDVSAGVMWMAGYQPTDGDFLYSHRATSESAKQPALTDEQIIERCRAAGITWIDPIPDDDGEVGYPGGFDMCSMSEMRALLASAQAAPRTGLDPEIGWMMEAATKGELAAYDVGAYELIPRLQDILSGKDQGAGVSREPWESIRRKLIALVAQAAPTQLCPRCKRPAVSLFGITLPGDELDTMHCGCLHGNSGVQPSQTPSDHVGVDQQTLGYQVRDAQRVVAGWSKEKRESVQLEGGFASRSYRNSIEGDSNG